MTALFEKYRPSSLDDVVGQTTACKRIKMLIQRGTIGNLLLHGPSATGKTTLARIVARMVSDPLATEEVDAIDLGLDEVRQFSDKCRIRPMFGEKYCFMVNEAHNLRGPVVSKLQTVLEDDAVTRNSVWIFTTTDKGHEKMTEKFDSFPLLSRFVQIEMSFTPDTAIAFVNRLMFVARQEGLESGQKYDDYYDLLKACNFNLRQALQEIDSGRFII